MLSLLTHQAISAGATTPIPKPTDEYKSSPATTTVKPSLLESISGAAKMVGELFDEGYAVYEKIKGRIDADAIIQSETVKKEQTIVNVADEGGFYRFYTENKLAVVMLGGGLALLTMVLLTKKIGVI